MKKQLGWRSWLGSLACAAAMVAPATAATVDFEDVLPTLFAADSIQSGGFRFTSDGFGFSGVDSAAAFELFDNAPTNASGQFLFMLNSDGMFMDDPTGASFDLQGFDLAFISPLPGLGTGFSVGELYAYGVLADGSGVVVDTFALPASDANGDFPFARVRTDNLAGRQVSEVYFLSCVYTDQGCEFDALDIPPQFALDNISVPEPASAALALAAIGLLAASRRRRSV